MEVAAVQTEKFINRKVLEYKGWKYMGDALCIWTVHYVIIVVRLSARCKIHSIISHALPSVFWLPGLKHVGTFF